MKKTISVMLSLILLSAILIMPVASNAANADSKAGRVNISSGHLNVRKSSSKTAQVVKTLKKNSYITLISKSGSWWYVEYAKGKYGYCYADYIKTASSSTAKVNISSGSLNVRKGAGTSYSKIASLSKNETVIVISKKGDWKRILYNGTKTGYVSAKYLSAASAPTTATTTAPSSSAASSSASSSAGYSAVSLVIPDFKQTDSRWANVKIGKSGKTIAQIGCATTAIAMIESYRSGKTIYPDTMSKRLSYSSSGSVYWPSDYKAVTESKDYLKKIYNQLKSKKAVLFGAKTSSGKQHWVVITGFTGSTLSASNFKINDPGSKSRTTLKDFLNEYPSFYKFFYY